MKFAILAAGEGSRLFREGVGVPKPLVRVGGETLIGRLLRIFHQQGAEETVVIVNQLHPETEAYVRSLMAEGQYGPIRLVVKTTPSSMHSFHALSPYLQDAPFCLTTVDTIFREEEFTEYIRAFKEATSAQRLDGMMAVTDFIDDELLDLVTEKLGKKRFKGYKVDYIDVQIVCHPSRKKAVKQ